MPSATLASSLVNHLHSIRQSLARCDLQALARQSGFLIRSPRKIPLPKFVLSLLALASESHLCLERVARVIGLAAGTSYSKQALHQRLSPRIEGFIAQIAVVLFGQLRQSLAIQPALQAFPRVLLHDSTTLTLPEHLAAIFPGSANQCAAKQAAVKVQLIWELRSATVQHLSLSSFRRNDQAAAGDILDLVQAGDLVLRDLGYWALAVFQAIAAQKAFFLSRFRHGTGVFDPHTGQALDLARLLRTHRQLDRQVCLGEARVPARLVAVPIPEALAHQRRRRARANRDRRLRPDRQRLFLLGWNIFVTNVDSRVWSPKAIQPIYQLRWHVEMIFKAWKSHLGLRLLNCRSADLLRLSLMTKLLFCVLVCQVCHHLELLGPHFREVSLLRLARVCAANTCLLASILLDVSPEEWFAHALDGHAFYDCRTDRTNFRQRLVSTRA